MDLRPEERYFSKEAYIQQIITWKDIQGNTKTNAKPNHNERLYTFQNGLRLKKKWHCQMLAKMQKNDHSYIALEMSLAVS